MGQSPKILIIDDDPDIRDALTMILGSQDYQVTTAGFGAQGLEKVKEDKPDLIILDLIMPGMGGFVVYKKLKDSGHPEWNDIRILILTSLREDATRTQFELETGMELAVDDYIEKPISSRIILERVGKILEKE
ncbi:MAG: response regulator [Chloroflexota bacterium]|nr:response regulator [Chloroflexota bacterium]